MSDDLDFTIITGLSGAGRSTAADVLEDLGYFVIDNVPPLLIPKVAELALGDQRQTRYALVIDVRRATSSRTSRWRWRSCASWAPARGSSSSTRPTTPW